MRAGRIPSSSLAIAALLLALPGHARAGVVVFSCFPLEAAQVVPPTATLATGYGTCSLDTTTDVFKWELHADYLHTGWHTYHFHSGAPGTSGPIEYTIPEVDILEGSIVVTPSQAADILAGRWYYDVHDFSYQAGELRGQIVASGCEYQHFRFPLTGAEVVPPTGSTAKAWATLLLSTTNNELRFHVDVSGLSGPPTVIDMHYGPPGTNAYVAKNLGVQSEVSLGATYVTDVDEAQILAGNYYVDVHTALHPDGEVRGQIVDHGDPPPWTNLGHALTGFHGEPILTGLGSMLGGSPDGVVLINGSGVGFGAFFLGSQSINVPLKGGILVPAPDVVLPGFSVNSGYTALPFTWPGDAHLVGFDVYWQFWSTDPAAIHGVAASNALMSTGQ